RHTSNAGRFLSLIVTRREDYPGALRRVAEVLPAGGVVFVQPVVAGREAGGGLFGGYYYERGSRSSGGGGGVLNVDLTAGRARGEVRRGELERADPWSRWLAAVHRAFARERVIDVEFACDAAGYVLLQVRPALFELRRNRLLTQANLKETFGDWPSPWTVSAVVESGRDQSFLTSIEPAMRGWDEVFTAEVGEPAWANLS